MNTKETLLEILEDIKPDVDYENENDLVAGGVLKSFDVMLLVSEIGNSFDVTIPIEEIKPENFSSLDSIAELVERLIEYKEYNMMAEDLGEIYSEEKQPFFRDPSFPE